MRIVARLPVDEFFHAGRALDVMSGVETFHFSEREETVKVHVRPGREREVSEAVAGMPEIDYVVQIG
ncbi:MAG: hypothetical protein IT558_04930 [Alphaproteobacteria bacterium]|nr:hypothetical protein [Alphaproteobacteria bacterium]